MRHREGGGGAVSFLVAPLKHGICGGRLLAGTVVWRQLLAADARCSRADVLHGARGWGGCWELEGGAPGDFDLPADGLGELRRLAAGCCTGGIRRVEMKTGKAVRARA